VGLALAVNDRLREKREKELAVEVRSYRELKVWQAAMELAKEAYLLSDP
jgi:hypothetical protein